MKCIISPAIGTEKALDQALIFQKRQAELITVTNAIKNHIQREVTADDRAKTASKNIDRLNKQYDLCYDGEKIGRIKITDTPDKFRVEFEPIQKSN